MPYARERPVPCTTRSSGDGPPLILLHGAYMTADMMEPARVRAGGGHGR